jgi:agmatine deiminase
MEKGSTVDALIRQNYLPMPFWAMDPAAWQAYASALKGKARSVLTQYPFKWAFAHPHDAPSAVEFLRDIGADENRVGVDLVAEQFARLPTFDSLVQREAVDWEEADRDDIPAGNFRMIPEWEPMAGTLINWPTFYPPLWETFRQMVEALSHATIFLRVPEGHLGAAVLAWLGVQGVDLAAVRPVPGPIGDIWARDYSPVYGVNRYTGEPVVHKFSFAAFHPGYRELFRSIVEIDERFAWTEGFKVYRTRIKYDGGYLLTDGNGTYVMTRRVLWDNAHIPNLYARLEAWLGADRLIIVDEEPGDDLGHIGYFKFISPHKMLVGMPDDAGSPRHQYYIKLHKLFADCGYEVVTIPCVSDAYRTLPDGTPSTRGLYANSLMMNGRVLVCQYGRDLAKYDELALAIYHRELSDYQVIPIECTLIANGGGGINCTTHEIPAISAA